jgi:hypothetical protein
MCKPKESIVLLLPHIVKLIYKHISTHVVVIIDLYHWCIDTGTQALDLRYSEHAILGSLTRTNAQFALNAAHDGI